MAGKRGGGALDHRFGFSQQTKAGDGLGGETSEFMEVFVCAAGVTHLRGGEAVQAARLQGQKTVVIRVRSSSQSRKVTADWRATDKRSGVIFNVRDVTPTSDGLYLDVTAQSGVAT